MAVLSSSSTLAQIKAEYDDTASYEEDADVGKAKRFITACRLLIRLTPTMGQKDGEMIQQEVRLIQEQLESAQSYVSSNDTGAGASYKHLSFSNFRS